MTVKQILERWGISDRRIRLLCVEGRIKGVVRKRRSYLIPANTLKLVDRCSLHGKKILEQYAALFTSIDERKVELDRHCPLTARELKAPTG